MDLLRKTGDVLSSFKLSVAILFGMFLLTYLGTKAQVDLGLFQSQKKYFESWLVIHQLWGPIHVPLPGGVLLMIALAVNLTVGGIVRLRWSWSRLGILITHLGIAFMLIAGAVKFGYSQEGSLILHEGDRGGEYMSYHEWEIAIEEAIGDGEVRQWLIPQDAFADRTGDSVTEVAAAGLPFRLEVSRFARNAVVLPKGPMFDAPAPVVDGFFVREEEPRKEADEDMPAAYVRVLVDGREPVDGILWGRSLYPLTVEAVDREFGITLRRKRYPMPFDIELTRFTHEYHPGTMMARVFKSDVLVHADGMPPEATLIEMNAPLRREGVIAFQSNWGPQDARPGDRLFSGFTIVENPSDQWPAWACLVIGVGMVLHFGRLLFRFIRAETKVAQ